MNDLGPGRQHSTGTIFGFRKGRSSEVVQLDNVLKKDHHHHHHHDEEQKRKETQHRMVQSKSRDYGNQGFPFFNANNVNTEDADSTTAQGGFVPFYA